MIAPTIDQPVYFDRLAEAEENHWWQAAMWRIASGWLDRALRHRTGLNALDIGCGAGGVLRRLNSRKEIGQTFGIDPSADALSHAINAGKPQGSGRRIFPLSPWERMSAQPTGEGAPRDQPPSYATGERTRLVARDTLIRRYAEPSPRGSRRDIAQPPPGVVRGSATALPFASGSMDIVCCFDTLQHLAPGDDAIAIAELSRVLRPNGVAIIRANGEGLWPDRAQQDRPYTLPRLQSLFRQAGLTVKQATHANALPSIATELLGRVQSKQTRHGHPQGRGLRLQTPSRLRNRIMTAISTLETFAITRLNARLPVGHSTMLLALKPPGGRP